MTFYVRIRIAVPDGTRTGWLGPFDRFLADLMCLSMADGWNGEHVMEACIVPASEVPE